MLGDRHVGHRRLQTVRIRLHRGSVSHHRDVGHGGLQRIRIRLHRCSVLGVRHRTHGEAIDRNPLSLLQSDQVGSLRRRDIDLVRLRIGDDPEQHKVRLHIRLEEVQAQPLGSVPLRLLKDDQV